jgi:hypothetical protein
MSGKAVRRQLYKSKDTYFAVRKRPFRKVERRDIPTDWILCRLLVPRHTPLPMRLKVTKALPKGVLPYWVYGSRHQ